MIPQLPLQREQADALAVLKERYYDDPIEAFRDLLPHWFPTPMPWVHRGIAAIILRRADFLLNFGDEYWGEGNEKIHCRWTKKNLMKIVKYFTYPLNPADQDSPRLPIFRINWKADGRTPDSIDIVVGKFTNLIMPREASKTTVANACLLYSILYFLIKYFVYISNTQPHANDQLATIKRELETNEKIIALFGNLVPDKTDEQKWRENEIETTTGILGATKGRGSQVRGMNKFSMRPDFILMDDIEDEESVGTPEQLAKTQKWYMKSVEPALSKVKGEGRLMNLATIQANNDISATHAKDRRFTTIRFGAMIKETTGTGDNRETHIVEPLWSHYMTKEKYLKLRLAYAARGMLYEFGLEYDSEVNAEDQSKFKAKHIQRYRLLSPEEFAKEYTVRALCIDPAISKKVKACPTALAVVGMNDSGFLHVFAYHEKIGMTPAEQVDKYFEFSKLGHCNRHGFEAVAYQAALGYSIREAMMRKQHWFSMDEIYPGQDQRKHQRIEGIVQPRTSAMLVTFNERWPELETQFLQWPNAGMDGPDVIAMCIALCDPYAGLALPKTVNEETGEEEPPEIMRDKTMEDFDYDIRDTGVP